MNWLLLLMPGLPLVLGLTLGLGGHVRAKLLVGAGLGSLLAVLLGLIGAGPLELHWILLGSVLAAEGAARALLVVAGLLWGAAAVHSLPLLTERHGRRYAMFFLLTLAGNLGLLVARDMATFYFGFAVMTFAAYGLVVHSGKAEALRAGRIYLVLAIFGEVLLLAGLFGLAAQAGNVRFDEISLVYDQLARPQLTGGLILAGFAVKMGVVPLHVWLPLAHPAAPVPASAVLSGIILKAGLLGWLHLLPVGQLALPSLGYVLVVLGLSGAFYAALVGCLQERPKSVLAYSSVSQMGLLAVPVGLWLVGRGEGGLLAAAITIFAVHHGLAKGALFLAVPMMQNGSRVTAWLSLLPVLALAGFPLTSGLLAKSALKLSAPESLTLLLTLTSVTTTLILLRFLAVAWPDRDAREAPALPALGSWLVLLVTSLLLPWWLDTREVLAYSLQWSSLRDGLWPVMAALVIALLLVRYWRNRPVLPEGDLLEPTERLLGMGWHGMRQLPILDRSVAETAVPEKQMAPPERPPWPELGVAGATVLMLLLVLGLTWLMV